MTSADLKTRKQDLAAHLQLRTMELRECRESNARLVVDIAVLKKSNRELARASQMARCTCPCCADGCDACKKSLAAERKAAKVGV